MENLVKLIRIKYFYTLNKIKREIGIICLGEIAEGSHNSV